MAMITVGGEGIPSPSEMKVTLEALGTGELRAASGRMVIDRMGRKRRLHLKWAYLTQDELAAMLGRMGEGFFSASYPDPLTGTMRTMRCYSPEPTAGVFRVEGGKAAWKDVEMEWAEV